MSIFNEIALESHKLGIGNTPLHKLGNMNIFSKLEYYNRFRSIKDRAAFFMIDYALKTGHIGKGKTIIEASSGNTGIAIAGISSILGIKSEIVIPEGSPEETKKTLKSFGSRVTLTQGNSTENSINYVEGMVNKYPDKYFRLNQYSNEMNSNAHYYGTGPEIDRELDTIDQIVIGVGTGGTITGLSRYFKEREDIHVTGVLPAEGSRIYGLRNPFNSNHKAILEKFGKFIDSFVTVTEDEAYKGVEELKEKYNLFCRPFVGC
jgi:cysteine synthase A/cysteine synthase B